MTLGLIAEPLGLVAEPLGLISFMPLFGRYLQCRDAKKQSFSKAFKDYFVPLRLFSF